MKGQSGLVAENADIYGFGRSLERILDRIRRSKVIKENKRLALEFLNECIAEGYSKSRAVKYGRYLLKFMEGLNKPFEEVTRQDLVAFVRKIEEKDYSDWTKRDYKIVVKKFFKWLRRSEDYPEEVRWIKARVRNRIKLPEEILTEEEVRLMARKAMNLRDRAFILVLYETGCRIGEILNLKIRNVQQDEFGAVLIVNGKTGTRRIRIVSSASALALWLSHHPFREDPGAPLWISFGSRQKPSALSPGSARSLLKRIAKRAGIKKRIYPHLFRHSRATHLANHLTEAQMKQYFGWVQGSRMAGIYVHLSGRDVDNAILRIYGLKAGQKAEESFKPFKCPRCYRENSPETKFCKFCGMPLSIETAVKLEETRKKADELLSALIRYPEVVDALLRAIERLKDESFGEGSMIETETREAYELRRMHVMQLRKVSQVEK